MAINLVFLLHRRIRGGSSGVTRLSGIDQATTPLGLNEENELFGHMLHAGEFTDDVYDDLLVGSPNARNGSDLNTGAVFLYRGRSIGISLAASAIIPEFGQEGEEFGYAIASGDFDGNGFEDIAIGSPGHNESSGKVTIYSRTSSGIQAGTAIYQDGLGVNEVGDRFGAALTTGDFNGDGYDDLAVGAPEEKPGEYPRSGYVFIFNGSTSGLRAGKGIDQQNMGANEEGDKFGFSLHSNDFDGDTYDDLAIGAPYESPGNYPQSGYVFLQRGSSNGLVPWIGLDQQNFGDNESGDRFGHTMTSGDYDNDGVIDLAIAAHSDKRYGRVFVFNHRDISTDSAASARFLHWYHFGQEY